MVRVVEARLPYLRFANVVARAQREVLREFPQCKDLPVIAYSWEESVEDTEAETLRVDPWGEFILPHGPICIYQAAYELMPDRERYYAQIKNVLRHEYQHATGTMDPVAEGQHPDLPPIVAGAFGWRNGPVA